MDIENDLREETEPKAGKKKRNVSSIACEHCRK